MTVKDKINVLKAIQAGNKYPLKELIRNQPVVAIFDKAKDVYKANGKIHTGKEFEALVKNKKTVFILPDNGRGLL